MKNNNNNNNNNNYYKYIFFLGILLLFIISHIHLIFNNINYIDQEFDREFLLNFKKKINNIQEINKHKSNTNNTDNITTSTNTNNNNNYNGNLLFPLVNINVLDKNKRSLFKDIYNSQDGSLLLSAKGELRSYYKAKEMPPSCGFGKLHFNPEKRIWHCVCSEPDYFGGIYCDEPQKKFIIQNNCMKVGHVDNWENTDISTFNPLTKGVCVECATEDAVPDVFASIPSCQTIYKISEEEEEEEEKKKEDFCFRDIVNPNFTSVDNKYIKDYGCVCDYYNGFVEVNVGGRGDGGENTEFSNGCLKIGKTPSSSSSSYHTTHIAFHTFKNNYKPRQVHEYRELEQPYQSLIKLNNKTVLLIHQPARDVVHKQDWLNRRVKYRWPKNQRIHGINRKRWDVVTIDDWGLNRWGTTDFTEPLNAESLATDHKLRPQRALIESEARYVKNAMTSRPIMCGSVEAQNTKWREKCTLNPLGTSRKKYYGLTMEYKPGKPLRIDTWGFENGSAYMVVHPPHYKNDLMRHNVNRYYKYSHWEV